MKIRAKLDLTVEMGGAPDIGTSCQGYLPEGSRYEDIVRVFGESQFGVSPDAKTKAEWAGKICGLVFTIYDYKSASEPKQNTDWHIGAKIKLAAELVNIYLKAERY
jgi:hypothetical protein